MGGYGKPEFRIVDGGKCFACHKNRGPILGEGPWTNSTHFPAVRNLVSNKLHIVSVVPPGAPPAARNRIDGMALVNPEAVAVDDAVRVGRQLRIYRETFRLMNRSPAGRQAFVTLLEGIVEPGVLDLNNNDIKRRVNTWDNDPTNSFNRFQSDWLKLMRSTNSGILLDFTPFTRKLSNAAGWQATTVPRIPSPPAGAHTSEKAGSARTPGNGYSNKPATIDWTNNASPLQNNASLQSMADNMTLIANYDSARSEGNHEMPSGALPSNPRAFSTQLPPVPRTPSGIVNTVMLAGTIGLTVGDRHFMIQALDEAAGRLNNKVSAKTLARAIFEGPEFADVLAGGPLPDRDEFKDRFVAGLDQILKSKYMAMDGYNPDRREYAYGPRFDRNAVEEVEAAIVPTTACLRCHDVRPSGKARLFESIPALTFDPLDKKARESWLKSAANERKLEVLTRIQVRLYKDADMPPKDSPEHGRFRMKEAAAFDQVKTFIETELAKIRKP
jgi:hypothetical protein